MYTGLEELMKMTGFDTHIKKKGEFIKDIDQNILNTRKNDVQIIDCAIVIAGKIKKLFFVVKYLKKCLLYLVFHKTTTAVA